MRNLLERKNGVQKTKMNKKISLRGKTEGYDVYSIRLDLLYYNDRNDRIATWISKYYETHENLIEVDIEKYNNTIEDFIIKSNENAYKKTKNNIELLEQREPGVVLTDGRIIDGNRRFTCLRKLYDDTKNQKFNYFDAIIIDGNEDDKAIKALELELQHGIDKQLDYNPIDKLVGVYKDVIKNQQFTKEEYRRYINVTKSNMEKLIGKAKLMVDFLDYANASEKYYIARELEIDGALQEIIRIKKKVKDDFKWDEVRIMLYDYLLTKPKGDITRQIRDIGKVVLSKHSDEFVNEHLSQANRIHEKIEKNDLDVKVIRESLRGDNQIKESLNDVYHKYVEKVKADDIREKPCKTIKKASSILENIDLDILNKIGKNDRETIEAVKKLKEQIKEIEKCL